MEYFGEFTPWLSNWIEDRLGCHRATISCRWNSGKPNRSTAVDLGTFTDGVVFPYVRSEHNGDEGGQGITNHYFEGVPAEIPDRVSYEFQGSFNQEPITSHPKIGELLKKYKGRLEDGEILWAEKDPTQQSKRKGTNRKGAVVEGINPMYGVQAYLAIGAVWTVTRLYSNSSIPSSILGGIGTIKTPPGAPPTPAGRNWLKMSPVGRTRGNVLEVADCYMLSGIGGWLAPVYDGSDIEGEAE